MKNILSLILIGLLSLFANFASAQVSGDNIFLPGHWVEVGIAPNGSLGSTTADVPAGYHYSTSGSTSEDFRDPGTGIATTTNHRIAMIYDFGHDGWTVGTPAPFWGDISLPGTPYEGWSIEIAGAQSNALDQYYIPGSGLTSGFSGTLTGGNVGYSNTGGVITATWAGTAGPGGALAITQVTTLDTNGSTVAFTVTLKNTSASTLNNIYYMRALDPDCDETVTGNYNTNDAVDYQNDYYHRVMVHATGVTYTNAYIALGTKDCRAKCFTTTGGGTNHWPDAYIYDAEAYYHGAPTYTSYTVGTEYLNQNNAIGLVDSLGNLAPGDSTILAYSYMWSGSIGIDSALPQPELSINGVATTDSVDTVNGCTAAGGTVNVQILYGEMYEWSQASWTWSPTIGLSSDTGINVNINTTLLSGMTTYTISGSDFALGNCETMNFVLTIIPTVTPTPITRDTSYCLGSTPGALTAAGTGLLWYTSDTGTIGSSIAPIPTTSAVGTYTYYVTQTVAGCQSAMDSIIVSVYSIGNISGIDSLCSGETMTLTDTAHGGTWAISGGVATITSSGILTAGYSGGTATVSFLLSSGCFSTFNVTVNPTPATITAPPTLCMNDSVVISDVTPSGTWSVTTGSAANYNSTTGMLTGITGGNVAITYTTQYGCDTFTNVTINTAPAPISGPDTVCAGSSITLMEDSTAGTWSVINTSIATISSSGVVTGITTGNDSIINVFGDGCAQGYAIYVNAVPSPIIGPNKVCEGSGIILTDPSTGTWSSSDTFIAAIDSSTGDLTGKLPGTVTISYTESTGCFITQADTVDPTPVAIAGPGFVCEGYTIVLSDDSTGGAWSSSAAGTATVDATGDVTGILGGSATITFTLPGGCYTTTNITVDSTPAAITGLTSVCLYSSITLSETSAGGTWSATNGNATVSGGIVTGANTGLDTIIYSFGTGCQATYTVMVDPLPSVIGGPDSVCASGGTIILTDTATGGVWSLSAITGFAVISSSGTVTGGSAGTVLVTYTIGTGCSVTDTITVNPLPAAISGASAVCAAGATTTLTDITDPGLGTWSLTDGTGTATISPTSGIITGETAGTATVTYTIPTGCFITEPFTINPLPATITGPDSVCVGATASLVETTGSGTWSTTNGLATVDPSLGTVTGIGAGIDTIIFMITASACETTFTVTINPDPTPIYGPDTVCASGSFITLFDSTAGGTWNLTDGTGTATINTTGGLLTGGSAGTVITTYQLTVTACIATYTVTVNPLPGPIVGPDSVCLGSSVTVTDATGGTWSVTNTGISTISTGGIVTGVSPGSDSIINVNGFGCETAMIITVDSLPGSITGPDSVCVNSSVLLADGSAGGTWSITNGTGSASVTATGGDVTGTGAGNITVNYTLITGCTSTLPFTVNPIPDAIGGPTTVCLTDSISLTETSPGGTWSLSNYTTGTISPTGGFTGTNVGTDTVTYTLITGCSISTVVTVLGLPNPITGPDSVCVGSQTNVFDATRGGTWSTTNNTIDVISAFGQVTGNVAGVDSIVYTSVIGCSVYMSFTVNPLPDAIGGPDTVCQNSQVTATDGVTGGTWTSSNTRVATIDPVTGLITGINRGVVTITYTLPTTCYVIESFTVNPLPTPIFGLTQVCVGSTINLFDGEPVTWSIAPVTIASIDPVSGIVTGIASGTATVTATNIHGCDETLVITVNPLPGAEIVPLGDTILCPGSFVTLTANTGSGYTYQWTDGGAAITGASASSLYASTTGLYGVTVTNTYFCSSTAQINVAVIPVSSAITYTGSDTICYGTIVMLNDLALAGLTYQWFFNGSPITGAISSNYGATLGGSYYVVANNSAGCSSTSDTVTINVLPTPAGFISVSGSMTFCEGGSVTFTGDTGTGMNYQWSIGGVAIAGATNQVFVADSSGTYTLNDTNSLGCTAVSIGLVVTANPLPADTITASGTPVICAGGSVTLFAPVGAGYTYQWYMNGFAITGATSESVSATFGGLYTVKVTTSAGCTATTDSGYNVTNLGALLITPITPTTFCWGSSAYLTIGVPGLSGIDFQWEYNGNIIPGATSSSFEAFQAGGYNVIISIPSTSCLTGTDTVSLTVNPLPDPVITYSGDWLMTQTYYTSYQWYENTFIIPGATIYEVNPTTDGDYQVYVTDTNGCQSFSDNYILSSTLSVANVNGNAQEIKVYPNPTHSMVYVESNEKLSGVLTTLEGNKVAELVDASVINMVNFADGVYLLTLYDNGGKLVKTVQLVKTAN